METIKHYIDKAKMLKTTLANNLIDKKIECSENENYNTLIPKVESIVSKASGALNLPDMSFYECDLPEDELNDMLDVVWLTAPSSVINYKFYGVTNLKKLKLSDINITNVTNCTDYLKGTSIEELDLSGVTTSTAALWTTVPQTNLKKLDLTNVTFAGTSLTFMGVKAEMLGLDTMLYSKDIKSIKELFKDCTNITSASLANIPIDSTVTKLDLTSVFNGCINLEYIEPLNIDIPISNLATTFYNCNKLSWDTIKDFLDWDNIDLSTTPITNMCGTRVFTSNYVDLDFDSEGLTFYRTLDKVSFEGTNLKTFSNPFQYCYINELDLSGLDLSLNSQFFFFFGFSSSYLTSIPGVASNSYYRPDTFIKKLKIHNSRIKCNTTKNTSSYSYFMNVSKTEIQEVDFDNVTFTPYSNIAENTWSGLFSVWSFKELDLSKTHFEPSESCTSLLIDTLVYYNCKNLERFIGPDLRELQVPITTVKILSSYMPSLIYFDISNIPLNNIKNISRLDDLWNSSGSNLEEVYYGENLGESIEGTSVMTLTSLKNCKKLKKECVIDLFNKLYDLNVKYDVANGGTLISHKIQLHTDVKAQLTEEDLAIATNKGWTIIT
jgi:uncharacterized protein YjbI with pentapeptide repeats